MRRLDKVKAISVGERELLCDLKKVEREGIRI